MPKWGERIFENSYDLRVVQYLSRTLDIPSLLHPADPAAIRNRFENGVLRKLLISLKESHNLHKDLTILAILAMRLGCRIDEQDMQLVKETIAEFDECGPWEAQVADACANYKNDGSPLYLEFDKTFGTQIGKSIRAHEEALSRGIKRAFPDPTLGSESPSKR